ncbi:hypothetical protein [Streptomyces sp. SM12]|uniref:hypothetical protein n=1 Tax=Streptomyces sp. SM12 TaxID=1071602 RepID=UPI000CD52A07|nr:hypothetical protein [Streptomyces sp. SM12]
MMTNTPIHTATGATVEFMAVGVEYELVTRNAVGEAVSTVRMSRADALELYAAIDEATPDPSWVCDEGCCN